MISWIIQIIKGIMIGIANAIPGVSGGTMMVSMGIYDDIISSVNGLFKHTKKSILTLLPYLIGMALGIVGLSFVITAMFTNFPLQTALLFIGLIFGGLPIIFKRVKSKGIGVTQVIFFVIFFVFIIALQMLGGQETADVNLSFSVLNVFILFLVGVIASATMVIPGVSGSLVLMIIGFYNPIMLYVKNFTKYVFTGNWTGVWDCVLILVPFGLGVVFGIFAIAKLIELLLAKFESTTYSSILGLVTASPIVILMQMNRPVLSATTIITSVVALFIGLILTYYLSGDE